MSMIPTSLFKPLVCFPNVASSGWQLQNHLPWLTLFFSSFSGQQTKMSSKAMQTCKSSRKMLFASHLISPHWKKPANITRAQSMMWYCRLPHSHSSNTCRREKTIQPLLMCCCRFLWELCPRRSKITKWKMIFQLCALLCNWEISLMKLWARFLQSPQEWSTQFIHMGSTLWPNWQARCQAYSANLYWCGLWAKLPLSYRMYRDLKRPSNSARLNVKPLLPWSRASGISHLEFRPFLMAKICIWLSSLTQTIWIIQVSSETWSIRTIRRWLIHFNCDLEIILIMRDRKSVV